MANYVLMVDLITLVVLICFSLSFGDAMLPRHNHPIAKPNCNESCGNVNIPFPFAMIPDCSLHSEFLVTCDYSFQPPQFFSNNSTIEITSISLAGQLNFLQFISRDYYHDEISTNKSAPWKTLSLFTVKSTANKFIAVGYDTYAIVQGYYTTYNSTISHSYITGACPCAVVLRMLLMVVRVVEEDTFSFSKNYLSGLQNKEKQLLLVLDWAIGEETSEMVKRNSTTYACKSNNSNCHDNSNGYRCFCMQGYDGNPYLEDGCLDIDECIDQRPDYKCAKDAICKNTEGNYTCTCPLDFSGDGTECNRDNPKRKIRDNLVIGTFLTSLKFRRQQFDCNL